MNYTDEFLKFIKYAKSQYHACDYFKNRLLDNGFIELNENDKFNLKCGNKYFFTRNNSSLFIFTIPNDLNNIGFNISAAHLDSPTLKLKPNALFNKNGYYCLDTEIYGGPIYSSFVDRPLDIAGRILINNDGIIENKLFSFDKGIVSIPNLCIHFNRDINKEFQYNPQENLIPILGKAECEMDLLDLISKKSKIKKDDILAYDLNVALNDRGEKLGLNDEFIMAPQIDNLESSYALFEGILNDLGPNINVLALFDNEEIGSKTRQGEKAADKVLRKEALVLKYAGHLYVNCRNLDCNTFSLDCNNYAQAFLYGGNKLLFAAYKINDAALLGSLAVDIVGIATPGVPGAATLVASDVIWYGAKDLVGFRCYLLEKSNEDGEAMVEGLNDDFMENLLKGNDALLRRYKSSEKKNDRLSASHILPILREKGLIKE